MNRFKPVQRRLAADVLESRRLLTLPPIVQHEVLSPTCCYAQRMQHVIDFDQDGELDLFYGGSGGMTWLQGQGELQFVPHVVDTSLDVLDLKIADIDSDGDNDVLARVEGRIGNDIVWLENTDGNGDQWQTHLVENQVSIDAFDAADFDSDGDLDVLLAGSKVVYWVEHQNSIQPFSGRHPLLSSTNVSPNVFQHLADFDDDGDMDVGYVNAQGKPSFLENRLADSAEWKETVLIEQEARGFLSDDINADGKLDLLLSVDINQFKVYLQDDGDWNAFQDVSAFQHESNVLADVELIDMNSDGFLDLVKVVRGKYNSWTENSGAAFEGPNHPLFYSEVANRSPRLADINHDGMHDLVLEDGVFFVQPERRIVPFLESGDFHASVDLDGDGDQDFLYSDGANLTYRELKSGRTELRNVPLQVDSVPQNLTDLSSVRPLDADGDGDQDLLVSDRRIDTTDFLYENLGNQQFVAHQIPRPEAVIGTSIGRNRNGADFLFARMVDDQGGWRLEKWTTSDNDQGRWFDLVETVFKRRSLYHRDFVSDMDGDGIDDYVNLGCDQAFYVESSSNLPVEVAIGECLHVFDAGDIDQDGDVDLVAQAKNAPWPVVWWKREADHFALVSEIAERSWEMRLVDWDQDGDLDAVNRDRYLENLGDGKFAPERHWNYITNQLLHEFDIVDIDGDGLEDILTSRQQFAWHRNVSPTTDAHQDGRFDIQDIDEICHAVGAQNPGLDIDLSGTVDLEDVISLTKLLELPIGDVNASGTFDSADLVALFQSPTYEDSTPRNSSWSQGDWNCNGDFETGDLVLAFQSGAYAGGISPPELVFVERLYAGDTSLAVQDWQTLDVHSDGDNDLVIHNSDGLFWFENINFGERFSDARRIGSSFVRGMHVVDIDSDGVSDVLYLEANGSSDQKTISWVKNNSVFGSGPANVLHEFDNNLRIYDSDMVIAEDLDGDQLLDFIISDNSKRNLFVSWQLQEGSFTDFQPLTDPAANGHRSVAVVDVDQNGTKDIVTANTKSIRMQRLVDGEFLAPQTILEFARGIAQMLVSDVDLDGDDDLLISTSRELVVAKNRISEGLEWTPEPIRLDRPVHMALADFDQDGDHDIWIKDRVNGEWTFESWKNNGGGNFAFYDSRATSSGSFLPTRIDADMHFDLFERQSHTLTYRQRITELEFGDANLISLYDGLVHQEFKDLTNDGIAEPIFFFRGLDEIKYLHGDGSDKKVWKTIGTLGETSFWHFVRDFDADGDHDVVTVSRSNNSILSWHENVDGSGTRWQRIDFELPTRLSSLDSLADFDGDGWLDLIGEDFWVHNRIGIDGSMQMNIIEYPDDLGQFITIADVDHDGDADLISSRAWYENETGFAFERRHRFSQLAISARDYDLDGFVEIEHRFDRERLALRYLPELGIFGRVGLDVPIMRAGRLLGWLSNFYNPLRWQPTFSNVRQPVNMAPIGHTFSRIDFVPTKDGADLIVMYYGSDVVDRFRLFV